MNRPVLSLGYPPDLGIRNGLFPMAFLGVTGEILSAGPVAGVLVSLDAARGRLAGMAKCAGEVMVLAVGAMIVTDRDRVNLEESVDRSLPTKTKTRCNHIAIRCVNVDDERNNAPISSSSTSRDGLGGGMPSSESLEMSIGGSAASAMIRFSLQTMFKLNIPDASALLLTSKKPIVSDARANKIDVKWGHTGTVGRCLRTACSLAKRSGGGSSSFRSLLDHPTCSSHNC